MGPGTTAQFSSPRGVAVKSNDVVVVADTNNYRIRLVATDGTVTTLAGSGTYGFANGPGVTAPVLQPKWCCSHGERQYCCGRQRR